MNRSVILLALLAFLPPAARAGSTAARGAALYRGDLPLAGTIVGHDLPLPASVVACRNCHEARGSSAEGRVAPDLLGGWLGRPASRRNGPASRYDQAAFCRALRTGVDPVFIVLPARMPRFTIADDDCAALWAYLGTNP